MKNSILISLAIYIFSTIAYPQYQNIRIDDVNSNQLEEVSIAINPTNPNYISAAANINHFFRSSDAGLTWQTTYLASSFGVWGDPSIAC